MTEGYDFIIVGGGSAGCVAAAHLASHSNARILLLERGPARASGLAAFLLPMPAAWMMGIKGSPIVELHQPVPQEHLGGRMPAIGQAAILGGGSSVNAMVYTRGQREDYDGWDAFLGGGSGMNYEGLLPYFRDMESNHRFNDRYHGVDGPLHVSDTGAFCDISEAFCLAAQGMGVPYNPDFNGARQAGVGTMQYTTRANRRWNAVDGFLAPAMKNKNLSIVTGATAARVDIERGRAVGVTYKVAGADVSARATSEVLLAAGAYNSPKLLLLSGVGPAAQLKGLGIAPALDLPGVGENLQDHHETPIVAATRGRHGYFGEDRGWRALRNGLRYLMFRDGPVASVGVEACAYVDPDGGDRPTIKMYCVPSVYLDKDVGGVEPTYGVTLNACLLRPRSRGSVRLRSSDPFDRPVVDNRYLAEPDDLRREIGGLRYARALLGQNPLKDMIEREILPGPAAKDDAALALHCRATVKTNWHPVGTCRMGPDGDAGAVLDKTFKLRGLDGLRVIDASAFPFIPSGNTNAPAMALASYAAHLIAGTAPKPAVRTGA
jgi:choline dehydrogenase-like flavoprotein